MKKNIGICKECYSIDLKFYKGKVCKWCASKQVLLNIFIRNELWDNSFLKLVNKYTMEINEHNIINSIDLAILKTADYILKSQGERA